MELIVYPFLVSVALFYMYETGFFVEYVKLFGLSKLFKIEEYENHLYDGANDSYWEWLVFEKRTFLRKLIACPYCFGFWLNVFVYFFYKDLGLFIINLWLSLFLFLILKMVARRTHE
jgi:hypothetical protein